MTAELALGLPLLLAVTVVLCWLLAVGVAQLRIHDAARETARAVARGDDRGAAVAVGRRVAPRVSTISVAGGSERVVVDVATRLPGPGVLTRMSGIRLRAQAVALAEQPP